MNNLKNQASYVYQYFTKGQHGGPSKGVTSDIAHGQTHNIDVNESASGLT